MGSLWEDPGRHVGGVRRLPQACLLLAAAATVIAERPQQKEHSSLMQTAESAEWPGPGGYPGYPGYAAIPAGYGMVLPPAMAGPPPAQLYMPQDQASLLQSGMGSVSQSQSQSQSHFNYGLNEELAFKHHENMDSYQKHVEIRERNEDIDKALGTLKGIFGDGSAEGGGALLKDEAQASQNAETVYGGVQEWTRVSAKTMEAAPAMETAAKAAAEHLASAHKSLAGQVEQHGHRATQRWDEGGETAQAAQPDAEADAQQESLLPDAQDSQQDVD